MLNTAVVAYAKEATIPQISGYPLPLSDGAEKKLSDDTTEVRAKGFEIPGDKLLTGLVLKDLDEPVPGKPFNKAATITSEEGTAWDIPVFWIDGRGKAVDVPEKGKSYMPLLVFFVPDGFTSDGILTLPPYLSDLFLGTGGVLTIADHEHGITYITGNVAELYAARNNGSTEESVSGKEAYTNTVPDQQEAQESSENPDEDENGGSVPASILRPFTENIFDLIDETQSASTDIYVIPDTMGFSKSTVPEEIITITGGKSDPSPILSPSEEKESSREIMGSGNQLTVQNMNSETGSEPDAHEQTLTSDDAEQEVSEPVCEEAADQETEKQEQSSESEPDQGEKSSGSGAEETDESYAADPGIIGESYGTVPEKDEQSLDRSQRLSESAQGADSKKGYHK